MNTKVVKLIRYASHGDDFIYKVLKETYKALSDDKKKVFREQVEESNEEFKKHMEEYDTTTS